MRDESRIYYRGKSGLEAIDIIDEFGLDFCLGNALKYITRAGKKNGNTAEGDLIKAIDYLNHELESVRKSKKDESEKTAKTIIMNCDVAACADYINGSPEKRATIFDLLLNAVKHDMSVNLLASQLLEAGFCKKRDKMIKGYPQRTFWYAPTETINNVETFTYKEIKQDNREGEIINNCVVGGHVEVNVEGKKQTGHFIHCKKCGAHAFVNDFQLIRAKCPNGCK